MACFTNTLDGTVVANCSMCEALRRRKLPLGLCPRCTHQGGFSINGERFVLVPTGVQVRV